MKKEKELVLDKRKYRLRDTSVHKTISVSKEEKKITRKENRKKKREKENGKGKIYKFDYYDKKEERRGDCSSINWNCCLEE